MFPGNAEHRTDSRDNLGSRIYRIWGQFDGRAEGGVRTKDKNQIPDLIN